MTDENDEIDEDGIKQRWEQVGSKLDERGRRLWAASEVQAAGHGALKVVSRITGLARSTINRGEDDLEEGPLPGGRVRVFLLQHVIVLGRQTLAGAGASISMPT